MKSESEVKRTHKIKNDHRHTPQIKQHTHTQTPNNTKYKHCAIQTTKMTTWATMPTMEEMANVIKMLQQQVAELQAEILRAAAKQAGPSEKMNLGQNAEKVSDFDGRQDNWADWASRPKRHVDGIHSGAEDFMEWAATQTDEVKKGDLELHYNSEAEEISEVM